MRTLLAPCGFSRPGGNPLRRGDRGVRFGSGLPGVDHLPHTHDLKRPAYTRGEPMGTGYFGVKPDLITMAKGLTKGAVELEPIPGKPGLRGYNTFLRAFEKGLLVRVTGDIIAMSPPLIIESSHIDQVFGIFAEMLQELA